MEVSHKKARIGMSQDNHSTLSQYYPRDLVSTMTELRPRSALNPERSISVRYFRVHGVDRRLTAFIEFVICIVYHSDGVVGTLARLERLR